MLCSLLTEQSCAGLLLLVDSNQLEARERPSVTLVAMLGPFATVLAVHLLCKEPKTVGENDVNVHPVFSVLSEKLQLGGLMTYFLAAFVGTPRTGKSLGASE